MSYTAATPKREDVVRSRRQSNSLGNWYTRKEEGRKQSLLAHSCKFTRRMVVANNLDGSKRCFLEKELFCYHSTLVLWNLNALPWGRNSLNHSEHGNHCSVPVDNQNFKVSSLRTLPEPGFLEKSRKYFFKKNIYFSRPSTLSLE